MDTTIAAVLQYCKLQSNWIQVVSDARYTADMHPDQKIIVAWMREAMETKGWNPEQWASRAGVSPTTITRAMKPHFTYISKRQTIGKLASTAGIVPPPIDGVAASRTIINAKNLEAILDVLLPLAPKGRVSAQSLRALAEALAHGLETLGDQISSPASEETLRVVARGVTARFHDLS